MYQSYPPPPPTVTPAPKQVRDEHTIQETETPRKSGKFRRLKLEHQTSKTNVQNKEEFCCASQKSKLKAV